VGGCQPRRSVPPLLMAAVLAAGAGTEAAGVCVPAAGEAGDVGCAHAARADAVVAEKPNTIKPLIKARRLKRPLCLG
jgi:hypothetical protein